MRNEGYKIPEVEFIFRKEGSFIKHLSFDFFKEKRVVIFSLPGAFTPTCSSYQLPGFEEKYDEIKALGIDEIYCISVNDGFVMNAWAKELGIEKVKLIPDGNAHFTRAMGQLVAKTNLGFGERSWRYAAIVKDCVIEKLFVEKLKTDNSDLDPYEETTPDSIIKYISESENVKTDTII